MRKLLLFIIAVRCWGQNDTGLINMANWQANLPPYEARCAAVNARIAAIANPTPLQADAIVNAQGWCYTLAAIRDVMVDDPAFFNGFSWKAVKAEHWTSGAEYFITKAEANEDPFAGAVVATRFLRSVMDGHYLYYVVYLPDPYPTSPVGADLYLHSGGQVGYHWGNENTPLTGPDGWLLKPDVVGGTTTGTIRMKPACRGEADYKWIDAAACIEEINHFMTTYASVLNVDKMVVGGGSAGGAGATRFAEITPDLWSAAYNMTGGIAYGWSSAGLWSADSGKPSLSILPFMSWNCLPQYEGNYNQQYPFHQWLDGQAATYPGSYVNLLKLDTDPGCYHVHIQEPALSEGWAWLHGKTRNRWPDRVILNTWSLGSTDHSAWVTIDTTVNSKLEARIETFIDRTPNPVKITVLATNIDRFHLNLASQLSIPSNIAVTINATTTITVPTGGNVYFWRTSTSPEAWSTSETRYPTGAVKKAGVSGPLVDFFQQIKPILFVYGTAAGQSDATQQANIQRILDLIFPRPKLNGRVIHRSRWEGQIKRDTDVTQADAANYNIVLVGGSNLNSYTANLAAFGGGLPMTWGNGTFTVSGVTYKELQTSCSATGALNDPKGCSYMGVFPNPRNQNNYLLLIPETFNLNMNSSAVVPLNSDMFVGYVSGSYTAKKVDVTYPQNWGTTGSGSVEILVDHTPTNPATGQTIIWNASAGTPPYAWTIPGCEAGSFAGNPISCSYAAACTACPYLVTDSAGNSGSGTIAVTGVVDPVVVSPSTGTAAADALLTWTVTGGVPPYTWTAASCSPASGTGASYACAFASAGEKTITATDSLGTIGSATATIIVTASPHRSMLRGSGRSSGRTILR